MWSVLGSIFEEVGDFVYWYVCFIMFCICFPVKFCVFVSSMDTLNYRSYMPWVCVCIAIYLRFHSINKKCILSPYIMDPLVLHQDSFFLGKMLKKHSDANDGKQNTSDPPQSSLQRLISKYLFNSCLFSHVVFISMSCWFEMKPIRNKCSMYINLAKNTRN